MEHVPPKEVWKLQPPRTQVEPHDSGCQQGNLGNRAEQPAYCPESPADHYWRDEPCRTDHEGQELQGQYRVRFSVSVLWALVYVPEGLPIGTLNTGTTVTSPASSLYEPQQFLITSGIYSSAASNSGTNAGPLRVWSPLARNLNPGDGIFFIWRALENVSGVETVFTFNYSCCVN